MIKLGFADTAKKTPPGVIKDFGPKKVDLSLNRIFSHLHSESAGIGSRANPPSDEPLELSECISFFRAVRLVQQQVMGAQATHVFNALSRLDKAEGRIALRIASGNGGAGLFVNFSAIQRLAEETREVVGNSPVLPGKLVQAEAGGGMLLTASQAAELARLHVPRITEKHLYEFASQGKISVFRIDAGFKRKTVFYLLSEIELIADFARDWKKIGVEQISSSSVYPLYLLALLAGFGIISLESRVQLCKGLRGQKQEVSKLVENGRIPAFIVPECRRKFWVSGAAILAVLEKHAPVLQIPKEFRVETPAAARILSIPEGTLWTRMRLSAQASKLNLTKCEQLKFKVFETEISCVRGFYAKSWIFDARELAQAIAKKESVIGGFLARDDMAAALGAPKVLLKNAIARAAADAGTTPGKADDLDFTCGGSQFKARKFERFWYLKKIESGLLASGKAHSL